MDVLPQRIIRSLDRHVIPQVIPCRQPDLGPAVGIDHLVLLISGAVQYVGAFFGQIRRVLVYRLRAQVGIQRIPDARTDGELGRHIVFIAQVQRTFQRLLRRYPVRQY